MKKAFDIQSLRGLASLAVLLSALLLPGCNETVTNIPGTGRAVVLLTVEPNPVPGVQNLLTGSVTASYEVRVQELSGNTGGTIRFITSTVFDPESGVQTTVNFFDSSDLKVFVGTDRLEPGGELLLTQTTSYVLPNLRVEASMTVSIQVEDDRGLVANYSILVPIVAPE
jgi:hypothetical protein